MPAQFIPRRIADLADVVSNDGKIPSSLLPESGTVPSLGYYLRFPGGAHQSHVDLGPRFWSAASGTAIGKFLWDSIFRYPDPDTGGYAFSDGYGGAHMLLWGIMGGKTSGNVNSSAGVQSFAGNYTVADNEWAHHAVAMGDFAGVGNFLVTYVNGVPDSMISFAGTRQTGGPVGNAFIGGSDHINAECDVCYMRAWDFGVNVFDGGMVSSFPPERFPRLRDAAGNHCHFYMPFHSVGQLVDYGIGTDRGDGVYERHHGVLYDSNGQGASTEYGFGASFSGPDHPYWVADANSPLFRAVSLPFTDGAAIPIPATPLAGAKVFDSFGRANQTHFTHINPSLGSTEAGSLGPLAWSSAYANYPTGGIKPWGILGGHAVTLGNTLATATVDTGSATQDIQIQLFGVLSRHPGVGGACFRWTDKDNFLFMWYQPNSWTNFAGGGAAYFYQCAGGGTTYIGGNAVPNNLYGWLRVTTSGTTITFYASPDRSSWTQIGQFTGITANQTATRAGLVNSSSPPVALGIARVKTFAAF